MPKLFSSLSVKEPIASDKAYFHPQNTDSSLFVCCCCFLTETYGVGMH